MLILVGGGVFFLNETAAMIKRFLFRGKGRGKQGNKLTKTEGSALLGLDTVGLLV